MKVEFLNSLVGSSYNDASLEVLSQGLAPFPVKAGQMITMELKAKTVILYLNENNQVVAASAGDPSEIE